MSAKPHILVIDPAMRLAEVECFNQLALMASLPLTYHLPAIYGMQSLNAEDMEAALGIIILGSASSVNERSPWQSALESWLLPHLERGIPTLGICYGQQMLAHMFGGEVAYVNKDQTKHLGFRLVTIEAHGPWQRSRCIPLCVSHNETVKRVPADFVVFAHSDAIPNDGIRHRSLPIYGFQPHPEATPGFFLTHDMPSPAEPNILRHGHELIDEFLRFVASRKP